VPENEWQLKTLVLQRLPATIDGRRVLLTITMRDMFHSLSHAERE